MSKLKDLVSKHDKYLITLEHKIAPFNGAISYSVKAKLTIPGKGNMYIKQVTTDFVNGSSLLEAEQNALDFAISRILGDSHTQVLVDAFPTFDISTTSFDTKDMSAPFGCKVTIVLTEGEEIPTPYRIVSGLASGLDSESAENAALKSAINKALGV